MDTPDLRDIILQHPASVAHMNEQAERWQQQELEYYEANKHCVRVSLLEIQQPTIVISAPTGVIYYTQAEGCSCSDREAEGFLVPLRTPVAIKLPRVFDPSWWYGIYDQEVLPSVPATYNRHSWWMKLRSSLKDTDLGFPPPHWLGLLEEIEYQANKWLGTQGPVRKLLVDPTWSEMKGGYRHRNVEAWVRVSVEVEIPLRPEKGQSSYPHEREDAWKRMPGFLTWQNCD